MVQANIFNKVPCFITRHFFIFGIHFFFLAGNHHPRDDETHSVAMSDTTTPRTRHTYVDDTYGTSLPPDLLAFPARVPTSPSMQSSQSNIPDQIIYGIRSPPLTSPVYAHMTPHGIYGTTTIAAATPNGFMTLQHPKSRNLALIAAANSRQQQSPFVPAPVVYSPAATASVVMKQGYMTIPRKPRVPSWAPSSSNTHSTQLSEFQSPTSPNPSETGTATTAELTVEPVYDNLGLRTTAGGSSTLNLNKSHLQEPPVRYTMRDRPLPATPSLTSVNSNQAQQQQQQQFQQQQQQHQNSMYQQQPQQQQAPVQQQQQHYQQQPTNVPNNASKIYEPLHELVNQLHQTTTSDTEPLYGTARHHSGMTIVPSSTNNNNANSATNSPTNGNNNISLTSTEPKLTKIPPRPPPKPKKKMSVTTSRSGHGSTSQLFDDEGEDGTEV